jgi:hypothetical protein
VSDRYTFGDVGGPVSIGGGVQNVAGRDQHVAGRDLVGAVGAREVLDELAVLRESVAQLRLTQGERSSAEQEIDAIEEQLSADVADRTAAGGHLLRFTAILKEAGALAGAAGSLTAAIAAVAHWLGPLGAGALALL